MIKKTDKGNVIQIDVSGIIKWCKTKISKLVNKYHEKIHESYKKEKLGYNPSPRFSVNRPTPPPPPPPSWFENRISRRNKYEKYNAWKNSPIPKNEFDHSLSLNDEFYSDPDLRDDYMYTLMKKRNAAREKDFL